MKFEMNQSRRTRFWSPRRTFDAHRFQAALGQQGFRQIAKLADGYQFLQFHFLPQFRTIVEMFQMPAVHLIFESFPCRIGQGLGALRQALQLAVGHSGIMVRKAAPLALFVEIRLAQIGHSHSILRAVALGQLLWHK